jgi:hypothetical protein
MLAFAANHSAPVCGVRVASWPTQVHLFTISTVGKTILVCGGLQVINQPVSSRVCPLLTVASSPYSMRVLVLSSARVSSTSVVARVATLAVTVEAGAPRLMRLAMSTGTSIREMAAVGRGAHKTLGSISRGRRRGRSETAGCSTMRSSSTGMKLHGVCRTPSKLSFIARGTLATESLLWRCETPSFKSTQGRSAKVTCLWLSSICVTGRIHLAMGLLSYINTTYQIDTRSSSSSVYAYTQIQHVHVHVHGSNKRKTSDNKAT